MIEICLQLRKAVSKPRHKRRINRGALPGHLPRIEIVVDIVDKTCPIPARHPHLA
jgi:hypothetical protein